MARRPGSGRRLLARIGVFGLLAAASLLPGAPARAQPSAGSTPPLDGRTEESLQEVARQINNPIGPLWQLTLDSSIVAMDGGGLDGLETAYTGSFQPTVPVSLGSLGLERFAWARRLSVITRLTLPFAESIPLPPGPGSDRRTGLGDIQLGSVVAPKSLSGFVWGIGPTFIFPSASDDALGQGKWQAGPAVLGGYVGSRWTAYAIAQQWWSFAGADDRPRTSQLCLAYTLLRTLPNRWQIGMQPSLTVDWTASRGNRVSLPVGLGLGKTLRIGKLPVQLWVEADYYPVRPDDLSGPRWGIDVQIIPVIRQGF